MMASTKLKLDYNLHTQLASTLLKWSGFFLEFKEWNVINLNLIKIAFKFITLVQFLYHVTQKKYNICCTTYVLHAFVAKFARFLKLMGPKYENAW